MVGVWISTGSQLVACESARHFETKSWHNLWINFDWYDRYNFANYNRILELGKNFARVCGREAGWRAGGSTSRGSWVVILLVTSLSESGGEPFETLVQTISGCGTSGLNVLLWESMLVIALGLLHLCWNRKTYPGSLPQAVETELVSDLGSVHGVLWQIQR